MYTSTLTDQVRRVMAAVFAVDESDIPDDMSQQTHARWDSLYHLTLILALEDQFETAFSVDEMPNMTSLAAIVAIVERHRAA
jgi:acyl carrier protein